MRKSIGGLQFSASECHRPTRPHSNVDAGFTGREIARMQVAIFGIVTRSVETARSVTVLRVRKFNFFIFRKRTTPFRRTAPLRQRLQRASGLYRAPEGPYGRSTHGCASARASPSDGGAPRPKSGRHQLIYFHPRFWFDASSRGVDVKNLVKEVPQRFLEGIHV